MERTFLFLAILLSACGLANGQNPVDMTLNRELTMDHFMTINRFVQLDLSMPLNYVMSAHNEPNSDPVVASNPGMALNIDEMVFQEHISKIIHTREIKEKIRINKFLKSEVYVSLGREKPFTQFELEDPLCCNNYEIFLQNNEKIFFNVNKKYLRVVNVKKIGDEIIYEVVTHSGGKGKTSTELHCLFIFVQYNGGYKLVKKSFNEVVELNIKSL